MFFLLIEYYDTFQIRNYKKLLELREIKTFQRNHINLLVSILKLLYAL